MAKLQVEKDDRWQIIGKFIDGLDMGQLKSIMKAPRWRACGQHSDLLVKPNIFQRLFGSREDLLYRNDFGFYPNQPACLVEHAVQMTYVRAVSYHQKNAVVEAAGAFDRLCSSYGVDVVEKMIKQRAAERYAALKIAELPLSVRRQDALVDVKPVLPLSDEPTKQDLFAGAGV